MPRLTRPRAASLPPRALPLLAAMLLAPALLLTASACGGDRAPASTAETTAAGGTTTAVADGATLGGDTALPRDPAATGRPVPGAPATTTATAPATSTASPPAAPPAAPAAGTTTAGATATAGAAGATGGAATATTGIAPNGATGVPATVTGDPASPLAPAGGAAGGSAQQPAATPGTTPASAPRGRAAVPFAPNERLEFDVRFGSLDVGNATMQLNGIETVRGNEVYHTTFRVRGGTLFFKVDDRYESWIDTRSLISHRFVQQIDEGSYERERTFEIYPERGVYRENQKPEQKTVAEPLDDGSFFYFVRTIPLEVGRTYTFERYFKPASNPVTIKVLRKERVKVPAGTFDAIVIQPIIKTKGIFGEGGRAEIWLADDSTRAMLQMKSQLKFGSLNLYLKRYRPGARPGAP